MEADEPANVARASAEPLRPGCQGHMTAADHQQTPKRFIEPWEVLMTLGLALKSRHLIYL